MMVAGATKASAGVTWLWGKAFTPATPAVDAPVQIAAVIDGEELELDEEALARVLGQVPAGTKVSVVGVAGPMRSGKSFILNMFLRYLWAGVTVTDGVRTPDGKPPSAPLRRR